MDLTTINNGFNKVTDSPSIDYSSSVSKEDNVNSVTKNQDDENMVNENQVKNAIDELNKTLKDSDKTVTYSMHKDSNTIVVKIKNRVTGEIIKEFPNEKNLDFISKIIKKTGLYFDQKK